MRNIKKRSRILLIISIVVIFVAAYTILYYLNLFPPTYTAEYFNIETVYSKIDFNNNGIDDYTDIFLGAKKDAKNHPKYNDAYYGEGYPPDNIGVCTDVVWRAFKNAGYSLRDMVDKDINKRPESYPRIKKSDNNIDFRRVRNLRIFFEEYAIILTIDKNQIEQWQAGDIVIFGEDKHIGIVSDKRNRKGIPYIIHNGGQLKREEDYLKRAEITGHYRFDPISLPEDIVAKWEEN